MREPECECGQDRNKLVRINDIQAAKQCLESGSHLKGEELVELLEPGEGVMPQEGEEPELLDRVLAVEPATIITQISCEVRLMAMSRMLR